MVSYTGTYTHVAPHHDIPAALGYRLKQWHTSMPDMINVYQIVAWRMYDQENLVNSVICITKHGVMDVVPGRDIDKYSYGPSLAWRILLPGESDD